MRLRKLSNVHDFTMQFPAVSQRQADRRSRWRSIWAGGRARREGAVVMVEKARVSGEVLANRHSRHNQCAMREDSRCA